MKCYLCDANLIWGGDHEVEDNEDWCIEANLSCPKCGALVLVYHPNDDDVAAPE